MKRQLNLTWLFAVLLLFAACGEKEDVNKTEETLKKLAGNWLYTSEEDMQCYLLTFYESGEFMYQSQEVDVKKTFAGKLVYNENLNSITLVPSTGESPLTYILGSIDAQRLSLTESNGRSLTYDKTAISQLPQHNDWGVHQPTLDEDLAAEVEANYKELNRENGGYYVMTRLSKNMVRLTIPCDSVSYYDLTITQTPDGLISLKGNNWEGSYSRESKSAKAYLDLIYHGSAGNVKYYLEKLEKTKGDGSLKNPFNAAAASAYAQYIGGDSESPGDVYINGKVVSIKDQYGTQYGNATFTISDDGSDTNTFQIYRALYYGNLKYISGELLNVGDNVIICGKVTNYRGTIPETVVGMAFLYSLNGKIDNQKWTSLGWGTISEDFLFGASATVEILQRGNRYRIRGAFDALAKAAGIDLDGNQDPYIELALLKSGDEFKGVTITQGNLVGYYDMNTGFYDSEYKEDIYMLHPGRLTRFKSEDAYAHNFIAAWQDNNKIGRVKLSPYYYLFDYSGGWNKTTNEGIVIDFPGYK